MWRALNTLRCHINTNCYSKQKPVRWTCKAEEMPTPVLVLTSSCFSPITAFLPFLSPAVFFWPPLFPHPPIAVSPASSHHLLFPHLSTITFLNAVTPFSLPNFAGMASSLFSSPPLLLSFHLIPDTVLFTEFHGHSPPFFEGFLNFLLHVFLF